MKIITICNEKGGQGKTTLTAELSSYLSQFGRVLMVDLDGQRSLTIISGINRHDTDSDNFKSVIEFITNKDKSTIRNIKDNLDLLPADIRLSDFKKYVPDFKTFETAFKSIDNYDYIIFDTPPGNVQNILYAANLADVLISPLTPDLISYYGLLSLDDQFKALNVKIDGIIINQYDRRRTIDNIILDLTKKQFGDIVYNSLIPPGTAARESIIKKKPIREFKSTNIGKAMTELLTEIKTKHNL